MNFEVYSAITNFLTDSKYKAKLLQLNWAGHFLRPAQRSLFSKIQRLHRCGHGKIQERVRQGFLQPQKDLPPQSTTRRRGELGDGPVLSAQSQRRGG